MAPMRKDWYVLERGTSVVIDTSTRYGKQFGIDACDSELVLGDVFEEFGCAGCRAVLSTPNMRGLEAKEHSDRGFDSFSGKFVAVCSLNPVVFCSIGIGSFKFLNCVDNFKEFSVPGFGNSHSVRNIVIEDPLMESERGFNDELQRSCSNSEGCSILILRGMELKWDQDLIDLFLNMLQNCELRVLH